MNCIYCVSDNAHHQPTDRNHLEILKLMRCISSTLFFLCLCGSFHAHNVPNDSCGFYGEFVWGKVGEMFRFFIWFHFNARWSNFQALLVLCLLCLLTRDTLIYFCYRIHEFSECTSTQFVCNIASSTVSSTVDSASNMVRCTHIWFALCASTQCGKLQMVTRNQRLTRNVTYCTHNINFSISNSTYLSVIRYTYSQYIFINITAHPH